MPGFHHILFPVDFSERCRDVRPFVAAIAQKFDAQVSLMHVLQMPMPLYGGGDIGAPIAFDQEAIQLDAERELGAFADSSDFCKGAKLDRIVEFGEPAAKIADFAAERKIDLIMMPTHGYGKFRSLLLGSTAAKVLHDVACPVWTATHEEAAPEHTKCESILCAVDLSKESVPLMQKAVELGSEFHAKVRVVHAVYDASSNSEDPYTLDFNHFLIDAAREEMQRLQRDAGLQLEVCIAGGSIANVLRGAAEHHGADLVVVGRGKLHHALGRLRTHAYTIIRDSPCPVLSF